MSRTLLIIGSSPVIDDYKEHINYLTQIYDSVGINSISTIFNTMYCAFVDEYFKHFIKGVPKSTKLITLEKYISLSNYYDGEFYTTFRPKKKDTNYIKEDNLAYFGFTHDLCISWGILKGYKNVILIGAADFNNKEYAQVNSNICGCTFNRDKVTEEGSINGINNFFTNFINIYTLNNKSALNVPRITLEELYNKILEVDK